MTFASPKPVEKSDNLQAFEHFLRTGQRFTSAEWKCLRERKYNHNHDDRGRFTFSSGYGAAQIGNNPQTHKPAAGQASQHRQPAPSAKPSTGGGASGNLTPFTQVGAHPARVYRTKIGAAIIDPRSGAPMLIPQGVSMSNTIRAARMFGAALNRDPAASVAFETGGPMDFQRTHSTLHDKSGNKLIDQRFVAIGNYNFGVYAAASGMSLNHALAEAAVIFVGHTRTFGTGPFYGNARNSSLVVKGYHDFVHGNVGN